jgi:hypothetical protein
MKRNRIIYVILMGFIQLQVNGQQDSSVLTITGFIDAYYYYNFNDPIDNRIPYATQPVNHNEFNINLALLGANYTSDRIRGNLALQVGTYPDVNYDAEPAEIAKIIHEANAGVRIAKDTWLDFGVMAGNLGYEPTLSIDRELYSSAFNTEYTPYYQMAVSLSHQFNEKLTAQVFVSNGWQNIYETNSGKAFAISLNYNVSERWNLYYSNYFGNNGTDSDKKYLIYNHLNSSFQVSDRFKLAASLDLGVQEEFDSEDEGFIFFGMIIADYQFSDHFGIAGRYEYVKDDGLFQFFANPNLTANTIRGCATTLNLKYFINDQLMLRMEAKRASSNERIFQNSDELGNSFGDDAYYVGFSLAARFSHGWRF